MPFCLAMLIVNFLRNSLKGPEMEENSKQPRIHKLPNPLTDSSVATFFLVVNPGLETQARIEAERYLGATRIDETIGGLQFDSTWGAVRLGQPKLRIATRVLVRVDQFGARDFQKLFRKVSNLPWEDWLKPKVGLSVRAASSASRLRIKSGIEESVVEAFKKSFKAPPPRPTQDVMCLVRVDDDICTISLDLSGDLLHKRGSHTDVGTAPLRETWAASIVSRVFEIATEDEEMKPVFKKNWQWIEPMAGTAVFLREALTLASQKTAKEDAGEKAQASEESKREFAIDLVYKFERDEKLKPTIVKASKSDPAAILAKLSSALIVDRDKTQLKRAEKALADATETAAKKRIAQVEVTYLAGDAVSLKTAKLEDVERPRVVLVNPPWGTRLKGPDATDSSEGQSRLLAKIEKDWEPTLVAIVFPKIAGKAAKVPKAWIEHKSLEFRAGGIPVQARFFTVPTRGA